MKINHSKTKLAFFIVLFVITIDCLANGNDPTLFTVTGKAKKVVFFSSKTERAASGKLSNGDSIHITFKQVGYYITVTHGNITKNLTEQSCCTQDEFSEIGVYEYDFDKDGTNELIIVHGNEVLRFIAEIFRYSGGLSERVGFIPIQFDIALSNDKIWVPIGSQGMGSQYVYSDGFIYEMELNRPDELEKKYYHTK